MAVAEYLDRIQYTVSGDLLGILAQIQDLEDSEFGQAFHSLSPYSYDQYTTASFIGAQQNVRSVQHRMSSVRTHTLATGLTRKTEPVLLASLGPYNFRQLFATGDESEHQNLDNLWASGLGLWGDQDEKAGYPGYDFNITAGTIGYDHTFPSRVTLGAAVSKGNIDVDLANNTGDGSIDTFSGMLYGSYFTSAAYVESALSYGGNSYESHRSLTIGSIQRTAASEHDGDVYSAYLGGGYFFQFGNWSVGPTAALRYVYLDEEGFAESGAGSVNLTVDGRQTQSLVSEVSLRAAGAVKTSWGTLIPEVSAGISYDFDIDDRVITAAFEGSPGVSFSTNGQDAEQLGAVFGCGLTLMASNGISTSLEYKGEYRDTYQSHGVMGLLRVSF
jgi:outer membrane autotransporter protein